MNTGSGSGGEQNREVDLVSSTDGKSDIFGEKVGTRNISVDKLSADAALMSRTYPGVIRVSNVSDNALHVDAEQVAFAPNSSNDVVEIGVNPYNGWKSRFQNFQFKLMHRNSADKPWKQVQIGANEDGSAVQFFSKVTIRLAEAQISYKALPRGDNGPGLTGVARTGDKFNEDSRFAAIVVPHKSGPLQDLDGLWHYRLSATCSDKACLGHKDSPKLSDHYRLPGDVYPESGAYDPVSKSFIVGSLETGNIRRVNDDGTTDLIHRGSDPWATLGVRIDAEARQAWVCAIKNTENYPGEVRVYNIDTGDRLQTFDLTSKVQQGNCNDIALFGDGRRAYVTDRENPHVYRLDLKKGSVDIWSTDDLLESHVVGTNGIAITPNRKKIVVTNYLPARLMVIDRANPNEVRKVSMVRADGRPGLLSGDRFGLGGADGIRFIGNTLYVMSSGKLGRITPVDDSWRQARFETFDLPDRGYSGLMRAGDDLFMTNGQPKRFVLGTTPKSFEIRRFDWRLIDDR